VFTQQQTTASVDPFNAVVEELPPAITCAIASK
jgi:hypothetical protein